MAFEQKCQSHLSCLGQLMHKQLAVCISRRHCYDISNSCIRQVALFDLNLKRFGGPGVIQDTRPACVQVVSPGPATLLLNVIVDYALYLQTSSQFFTAEYLP